MIRGTCLTLIQHVQQRDRAEDVEQFDDILRTLINETDTFENRFGTIRDADKMLAVKKLMLESLLNNGFRGTTKSYSKLLVALESIVIHKVATVPTATNRNIDTVESFRGGGDQRIVDLALQAVRNRQRKT